MVVESGGWRGVGISEITTELRAGTPAWALYRGFALFLYHHLDSPLLPPSNTSPHFSDSASHPSQTPNLATKTTTFRAVQRPELVLYG